MLWIKGAPTCKVHRVTPTSTQPEVAGRGLEGQHLNMEFISQVWLPCLPSDYAILAYCRCRFLLSWALCPRWGAICIPHQVELPTRSDLPGPRETTCLSLSQICSWEPRVSLSPEIGSHTAGKREEQQEDSQSKA